MVFLHWALIYYFFSPSTQANEESSQRGIFLASLTVQVLFMTSGLRRRMKFEQVNAVLKQQNLNVSTSRLYREMEQKGLKSFMMFSLIGEGKRNNSLRWALTAEIMTYLNENFDFFPSVSCADLWLLCNKAKELCVPNWFCLLERISIEVFTISLNFPCCIMALQSSAL